MWVSWAPDVRYMSLYIYIHVALRGSKWEEVIKKTDIKQIDKDDL